MSNIEYRIDEYTHWQQGTRVAIYLDPEEDPPVVETWACIGNNGQPMRAFHGRLRYLGSVDQTVVGSKLEAWLQEHEDTLLKIAASYEGAFWNGNNHVGKWTDAEALRTEAEIFQQLLANTELATYWDADSWFDPVGKADILEWVMDAGGIEAYAEQETEEAQANSYYLDESQVADYVCDLLKELAEDDDNFTVTERAIARRAVLGVEYL